MSEFPTYQIRTLDPWAASSLLQKAIRRGEVSLAQQAAATLHRQRGNAIWRRLMTIAVEDAGIADVALISDVARLGSDKMLRTVLGSDGEIVANLCARLAAAPKERSADYLYCAATKLPAALIEREQLSAVSLDEQIQIAATVNEPLIRRATAALLACTSIRRGRETIDLKALEQLLSSCIIAAPLELALMQFARANGHPFALMLPLLWSYWQYCGAECRLAVDLVPEPEFVGGVPLYAFDKHTAAGKRAIAIFCRENADVAEVLHKWVPEPRRTEVAEIAAFYADACPVSLRFEWEAGPLMSFIGLQADMMGAGCAFDGVEPVVDCVRENLGGLNDARRSVLQRRPG